MWGAVDFVRNYMQNPCLVKRRRLPCLGERRCQSRRVADECSPCRRPRFFTPWCRVQIFSSPACAYVMFFLSYSLILLYSRFLYRSNLQKMKPWALVLLAVGIVACCTAADPLDLVDTRIGNAGFGWGVGGSPPAAQYPFGSMRLSPDTVLDSTSPLSVSSLVKMSFS